MDVFKGAVYHRTTEDTASLRDPQVFLQVKTLRHKMGLNLHKVVPLAAIVTVTVRSTGLKFWH